MAEKKRVLFVCIENSCRSQIAEGFARKMGEGILDAYSAGSRPSGEINPLAIKVMEESGIDIGRQASKGFNDLPLKEFDYVITMGCRDVCPFVPAARHIEWHIDDPKGRDMEFFRAVRGQIKEKVSSLIEELKQ